MRKIIVLCICMVMYCVNAVAQYYCDNPAHQSTNVYFPLTINGTTYQFEGKNAHIAAAHLQTAKERHFLNLYNVKGKNLRVYRLKKKGEYAIAVNGDYFLYRENTTVNCRWDQLKIKWEIFAEKSFDEGYALGYDKERNLVLAIYRD